MELKYEDFLWWQKEIVYQIYPRSFKDANGDGVGDLKGILEKLDYLHWLGIRAIWISPIYPSPMADFGYDIKDYCGIHRLFGTMADFDELLHAIHKKGMKLILDLVPNHTSDEHPWFIEASRSRDSATRDWYIWKDPAPDGGPPNNWISEFGGSAWEYHKPTGQYYYHAFLKEQPDLNWRNPEVQEAMFDVMRFWMDKGVDGFRVDVIWHIVKDHLFRDDPPNPDWTPDLPEHDKNIPAFSNDQPYVHEIIRKMRQVTNEYEERVLIGEIYLPVGKLVKYYGIENQGVHLPFNFHLIVSPWKAADIYALIADYEGALPPVCWPTWVLGNHDKARVYNRIGKEQLRNAAILLLTLKGTPTIYYGEEIAMRDVQIPPDRVQDPREHNEPDKHLGRDPQRTPMQWDSGNYAGFSNVEPWLPIAEDFKENNVALQKQEKHSMLHFYKRLIELRQNTPALHVGEYIPAGINGNVFGYCRVFEGRKYLVVLNLGEQEGLLEHGFTGEILISSNPELDRQKVSGKTMLPGNGGFVAKINS